MFTIISPDDELTIFLYWYGNAIMTSAGRVTVEGDVETLEQHTRCQPGEKETAIYLLEKTIDCLKQGSSDPDNPTVLNTAQ